MKHVVDKRVMDEHVARPVLCPQVRVKNVNTLFYTPARADALAEAVARTACLRLAADLEALDAEDAKDEEERQRKLAKGVRGRAELATKALSKVPSTHRSSLPSLAITNLDIKRIINLPPPIVVVVVFFFRRY